MSTIRPVGNRVDRRIEMRAAYWPLLLWAGQIVVGMPVLAYATHRLIIGKPPGPVLTAVATITLLWTVLVIAVASLRRGREWIRRHKWELLLCFAAVILTGVVFDLMLTISGTVPTIRFLRERSLEYRPSVSTRHRLVAKTVERLDAPPVRINSRGLRGKDLVSSPGRLRLLFLGGSQVFDFDNDWPGEVELLLREQKHDIEILNAAVPGHSTADSVGKLITDYWLLEPDLVFVCHAWNDMKYFARLSEDLPYRDLVGPFREDWRLHPRGFDRLLSYSAFYRRFRNKLNREIVGDEGWVRSPAEGRAGDLGLRQLELNLRILARVTRDLGSVAVLCKQARLPVETSSELDRNRIGYSSVGLGHDELVRAFALVDRTVEQVARDHCADVVDLNGPFSGRSELFRDHVHLTRAGSEAVARVVAARLSEILMNLRDSANADPHATTPKACRP